jgi:hypothetical protein
MKAKIAPGLVSALLLANAASAQVDPARAVTYLEEVAALCGRDAGRLWGVSLCGPMAFVDAATQTIATNEPAPTAPWPRAFGYANTAMEWGGRRWSTVAWSFIPIDAPGSRQVLLIHELFHRIQPDLGLMAFAEGSRDHLDTLDGRYWVALEWRALKAALAADGADRRMAIADALAFRAARRALFPDSVLAENADEIREGLAQYTGAVIVAGDAGAAVRDAIAQLGSAEQAPTYVRSFGYAPGVGYGVLLDASAPDWRRGVSSSSDLGALLGAAVGVEPSPDAAAAAQRYDGATLRASEERRELERQRKVAELTSRFVDGPVVRFPRANGASFITTGAMPIPGFGTVYVSYRAEGPWGTLDVEQTGALVGNDTIVVPAPAGLAAGERAFAGDGWRAMVADGWVLARGARAGDYALVPATQ